MVFKRDNEVFVISSIHNVKWRELFSVNNCSVWQLKVYFVLIVKLWRWLINCVFIHSQLCYLLQLVLMDSGQQQCNILKKPCPCTCTYHLVCSFFLLLFFNYPKGRLGMSDVSPCRESQLSFDSLFLSPVLFFCLFLLLFLSCHFSANGPLSWVFSRKLSNIFCYELRFFMALVEQLQDDGRWYVQLAAIWHRCFPLCIYITFFKFLFLFIPCLYFSLIW